MPAVLQPIARLENHVQHTHASTGRSIGAFVGSVVGTIVATVVIVGAVAALAAIEVGTFGAATPFVVAAGVVGAGLLGAGTAGYTISAFSNVGADLGRMITEDEGQITTGEPSVLIGAEQKACAHIESNVSCKLHKHQSSPAPNAPDVIDAAQEQLVQGSQTVRVGRGRHPVSRIGSKGTCGFTVGEGCPTVIVGGPTVTIGVVGDGDDPDKKAFDELKDVSGKLMLAGICLLSLSNPMLLVQAGLGIAVISTGLDMLPPGLPRDLGEAVVSMLPLLKARDVFGGKDPVDPAKTDTDVKPDEETKPAEETKPTEEIKPDTDTESKPAPRPAEEAPRPAEEAPRPAEEAPRPAEEAPRPAEEAPSENSPAAEPEGWKSPCFLAGTQVATTDGMVGIDHLFAGECVLARDFASPLIAVYYAPVLAVHTGSTRTVVQVSIGEALISCTRQHPFFVQEQGWKDACTLQPNDLLLTPDNSTVRVSAVHLVNLVKEVPTYNLTVETAHTYYVLAGSHLVLVHNGPPPPDFNQPLYWLFGKKPGLRTTDTDGLSIWRTDSQADVEKMMRTRSETMGRSGNDPHGYWTQEQFDTALNNGGLAAPQTDGTGPVADALGADHHHSVRPADAPDGPLWDENLSPEDIKATDAFKGLNDSLNTNLKPSATTTPAKVLCG